MVEVGSPLFTESAPPMHVTTPVDEAPAMMVEHAQPDPVIEVPEAVPAVTYAALALFVEDSAPTHRDLRRASPCGRTQWSSACRVLCSAGSCGPPCFMQSKLLLMQTVLQRLMCPTKRWLLWSDTLLLRPPIPRPLLCVSVTQASTPRGVSLQSLRSLSHWRS